MALDTPVRMIRPRILLRGSRTRKSEGSGDVYNETLPSMEVWVKVFGDVGELVGFEGYGCAKKSVPVGFEELADRSCRRSTVGLSRSRTKKAAGRQQR